MKRYYLLSFALVLVLLLSLFSTLVSAQGADTKAVVDEAGLLTEGQESELSLEIERINQKYGISVMIYFVRDKYPITIDEETLLNHLRYDSKQILESMKTSEDAILYYMSLDGEYRDYYFSRTGECYNALEYGREVAELESRTEAYMTKNDFYGAATEFLLTVDESMQLHFEGGSVVSDADSSLEMLLIATVVSLVIALTVVLIMKAKMKSVRPKGNAHMYVVNDSLNIRHSSDIYLFETVTRRPIPKADSSSSRGGRGGGRC